MELNDLALGVFHTVILQFDKRWIGMGLKATQHVRGQEPFDAVMMFKALLLGQWQSLSDATLIESAARPSKTITIETDSSGAEIVYEDKGSSSQPGLAQREKDQKCNHA